MEITSDNQKNRIKLNLLEKMIAIKCISMIIIFILLIFAMISEGICITYIDHEPPSSYLLASCNRLCMNGNNFGNLSKNL